MTASWILTFLFITITPKLTITITSKQMRFPAVDVQQRGIHGNLLPLSFVERNQVEFAEKRKTDLNFQILETQNLKFYYNVSLHL